MKKFIAVVACLASVSSFAQSELSFGDQNYFLKQGELFVSADVNLNSTQERLEDTTGGSDELETEGYFVESRFAYALANNLNIFLGLDYRYDVETSEKGNADYSSDGLANPLLGANFRLMNQGQAAVNVDFGAVARLKIQDQEVGSATGGSAKDGNAAVGHNSLELNSRIGRKWNEANEWQLGAGVIYNADGEFTSLSSAGDVDFDTESSMDLYLRAIYQYRPVHEFMMNLTVQGTRFGEVDTDASGVSQDYADHLDIDVRFQAKYLLTDNFIVKFDMGQGFNPDYKISSNVAALKQEVNRRHEYYYGLGADFLF